MNKKLLGTLLLGSLFVAGSVLASPITINNHNRSNSTSSNSTSSSGSTSGANSGSNSGSTSTSGAGSSSGGNSITNGPTVNLPSEPETHYFQAGNILVGGGGQSPSVFVVMPKVSDVAVGVQIRDGAVYVDGQQRSCDQQQRAGLPKCFTLGGK